ncbi:uncharacterized protein ELE39_002254 [Cryptosporidium sp. chipmunk genotype I]|uniref:uncharacterized protein n=1 Tax=Cryptosporidium sp. chipmunk genotype I TaxID=1280935 RepID=UPI00351A6B9C|nr:hypothetical protein ELE39_002254 [Cryptosporidium sp. chipmunk genotype I]
MRLKKGLILTFAISIVVLGITFKLIDSTDFENKLKRESIRTEEPSNLKSFLIRENDEIKIKNDTEELELELEAFKVASELSTSFIRKVPQQFKEVYRKSDGTAESMYKNCIYGFLILTKNGKVSPILYVRTLVYKLGNNYYFDLGEIEDEKKRENAQLIKLHVGEAIHLFCMKASTLFYSRDETRPLDRKIKRELVRLEQQEPKLELEPEPVQEQHEEKLNGNIKERPEIMEIMLYLTELLDSEISSVEMDKAIMNRKRKEIKSIWEIGAERKLDREKIKEYKNMVRLIRVPLPESRLRDRYGKIHHPDSENKLRVPTRVQKESDKIKSKLNQIKRDEKILMGGSERFVDFERKKFLEAALKRNQKLSFEKNKQIISDMRNEDNQNQEARLKCECDQEDDCECRIVDLYGEVLGKPVSIKLEEDLFNDHQIFRNKDKNRKVEVNYFKGLIYGRGEKGIKSKGEYNCQDKSNGISLRRKLNVPNSYVEIPLTGLSKLQLLTLEQLSGIDINARSSTQFLPRIKEINHEKNTKVSESVPINEDDKGSAMKKPKGILHNRNRNHV